MPQFERRIYLGIFALVASFTPLIIGAFISIREVVAEQKSMVATSSHAVIQAERLRYLNETQTSLMADYMLTGNEQIVRRFEESYSNFAALCSDLLQAETDPHVKSDLEAIQALEKQLHSLAAPGIALRRSGAPIEKVNRYFERNGALMLDAIEAKLNFLTRRQSENLNGAKVHLRQTVNWVIGSLVALSCFSLFLVIVIGRLMVKVIWQKRASDLAQAALLHKELEEAHYLSRARKEAVEIVAHDLKSPLASIRMSLDLIREQMQEGAPSGEIEQGLRIALRSTASMENLIATILDHAKIEAGQLVLDQSDCDLSKLTHELLQRFSPIAKAKGVTLEGELSQAAILGTCDQSRIEQVLSNLLGNAIKFTPPGGSVKVLMSVVGGNLLFVVEDTGIGIAKHELKQVFDRFWQARATAKNGHGLGLAISQAIIEAHRGKIWGESELGRGSRFSVSLPVSQKVSQSAVVSARVSAEGISPALQTLMN